jgi:hypothetical protein
MYIIQALSIAVKKRNVVYIRNYLAFKEHLFPPQRRRVAL